MNLFLTILEAGNAKINVLMGLVFGKDPFPDFQDGTFPLYSHMMKGAKCIFYKDIIPSHKGSNFVI
jgi:hypothetical protein